MLELDISIMQNLDLECFCGWIWGGIYGGRLLGVARCNIPSLSLADIVRFGSLRIVISLTILKHVC